MLVGQVRRGLSVEAVRSQARCLLQRLSSLGAGAQAAAQRRGWADREEQRLGSLSRTVEENFGFDTYIRLCRENSCSEP